MKAYLKRHLFDGERLRRRTFEEFAVAMRSGRLIAFVGSMATKDVGYGGWKGFLSRYANLAETELKKFYEEAPAPNAADRSRVVDAIEWIAKSIRTSSNPLTLLSVIEHAIAYADEPSGRLGKKLDTEIRKLFDLKPLAHSRRTTVQRIVDSLNIDRVITLNYDLEFEWQWMTTASEKKETAANRNRRNQRFEDLIDAQVITEADMSLSRILPSGRSVVSDVFQRDRTDRLIEFAVGSPDYEAHVLHLHGMARYPTTMVVSQWDYNQQYRRSGVTKLPFEHGLKVLFAGNPILFIGVGMSESDVTATLEQIVSDHPDRRMAPAFLLWNAPSARAERNEKRFTWLHRFGISTIFDDEIAELVGRTLKSTGPERFDDSIENLGLAAQELVRPFPWKADDFRNIKSKLSDRTNVSNGRFDIWPPPRKVKDDTGPPHFDVQKAFAKPMALILGKPGVGRGYLTKYLRSCWERQMGMASEPKRRSMIINASFVFEIESVFSLITGLADGTVASDEKTSRRSSLFAYTNWAYRSLTAPPPAFPPTLPPPLPPPPLLILINGMERFFSPAGQPLSTELDSLMRMLVSSYRTPPGSTLLATPPVRLIMLATKRLQHYFGGLGVDDSSPILTRIEFPDPELMRISQAPAAAEVPSRYFRGVAARFERAGFTPLPMQTYLIDRKATGELSEVRRYFLAAYFQSEALEAAGAQFPDLCLDIVMVMAFVGQPVENAALYHAEIVQRRLRPSATPREDFNAAMASLARLGLIIERAMFDRKTPRSWRRYGLHRAVLTEVRDRVGIPLSDSRLSGGFNLSLFAAQPVDGYSPEPEIHEELDVLVDWLIGAYKDEPLEPSDAGPLDRLCQAASKVQIGPSASAASEWKKLRPHSSACLRAALALVRNYYSTAALLTIEVGHDPLGAKRDAPLSQHGERLDRLIRAATDNVRMRNIAHEVYGKDRAAGNPADWIGPAPFYPDDLIWLYNERGVVKLTQGDLYEARHSFDEALRLNSEFVEFGDQGQNWRRIMLNQLHVDIERARLDRAEDRIAEIQHSLEIGTQVADPIAHVVEKYGKRLTSASYAIDPEVEHDIILTVGLLHGYRGLVMHLRGELNLAYELFKVAVNVLENIGEQRAYAMFQRHFALLKAALARHPEALASLKTAVASSEAMRQTDIAHYARISEAWQSHISKTDPKSRSALIRRLQDSLVYAEMGDMHRVRVEAGLNLARVKFEGGDYDSALERIADAITTATRYGLSLRKISLRILMGQILTRRGDRRSGPNLISRATRNADRVGYQGAVGLAQRVQALEGSGQLPDPDGSSASASRLP